MMVWGGISFEGHTDLYLLANSTLTAVRSWDIILRATVRLYTGAVGPVLLLVHEQHDNTCPNLARLCRQFLDDKGVDAINWPSRSPHLNPIENLWDVISEHQENVQELTDALIQVWQEMSQDILRLIRSMPKCFRGCTQARGATHTTYLHYELV